MKPKSTLRPFLALAGSALLAISSTHAGQNWDGGSSVDSNISTASNWDGATVNADGTGVVAAFGSAITLSGNTRNSINNNRTAASSFAQISFSNDGTSGKTNAFSITGNSMTLTNNLTTSNVTTGPAITDSIGVNVILNTNPVIAPGTNHHLSITGVISGANYITKRSAGTLILSNTNSYSGSTFIEQGTIIAATDSLANTDGAFGKQTSNINLGLGGSNNAASILINDGNFTVGRAIRNATNDTTDSGTRVLTLGGNTAHNTEFSGDIFLGTTNFTSKGIQLTAAAGGQVTFSGVIQNPTGQDATEATAAAALTAVTKVGAGAVILSNTNTYTGATTINQGTLKLGANDVLPNGSAVSIGTATLDADTRTDTLGTLNVTGNAVINLGSGAALAFADSGAGGAGTWAGTLDITGTLGATSLKFGTGSGGLSSAQLAKISVNGSGLGTYTLDASGYLIAGGGGDVTPPTLTSITDDKSGGPVAINTLITYTVTFSEDIDSASVSSADFDNNGTAGITIGTITETTPGVFTVQVTPTSSGTLKLRIPTGAVVKDVAGNNLVVPVADDTTITVQTPYETWAGGAVFNSDANGDGVSNGLAWLLGASGPNAAVTLPTVTQSSGNLVLTFQCLKDAARGSATLSVDHSSDLGISDAWLAAPVTDAGTPLNNVSFSVSSASATLNNVTATISSSEAASGKLFGRVKAVNP